MIVMENGISWGEILGIQSNLHVVYHILLSQEGLKSRQTWSLADQSLTVNDGGVHPSSSIEDAEGSVEAHIDKVLTLDHDLGSSISGTAWGLQALNNWRLIVKIRESLRSRLLTVLFVGD